MVFYAPSLVKVLSLGNATAMALYPVIITSLKQNPINLIQHEKIHHKQQLELLILPFYIWYLIEFLYHFSKVRNRYQAYMSISFEKEAYDNENDKEYLNQRKRFNFWNYL